MSKVVHLSKAAHERAKQHCSKRGMSMSDWVAGLIDKAVRFEPPPTGSSGPPPAPPRAPPAAHQPEPETFAQARAMVQAQRRDRVPPAAAEPADEYEEAAQIYAAPPFWDREAKPQSVHEAPMN